MNTIRWEPIDNSFYSISDDGQVMNTKTGRILLSQHNVKGYLRVRLFKKHKTIHRLVAIAFIPNPNNLPQVNHKDGNKLNNHYTSLEWCTNDENNAHAIANGINGSFKKGERHQLAKLTEEQARIIKYTQIPTKQLAAQYGVKPITAYKIRQNMLWKHI